MSACREKGNDTISITLLDTTTTCTVYIITCTCMYIYMLHTCTCLSHLKTCIHVLMRDNGISVTACVRREMPSPAILQ